MAKALFDRTVSAVALLLLVPVLLAIALAVKSSSPGPVLFRQVRVGKGGQTFTLLKFRSMVVGSERMPNVCPAGDCRVTPVGRFLRRWYLDELPQLLNVLRGDMSFVGPRPETPEFVARLLPEERALLDVTPGLVGPSTLAFMDEAELLAEAPDPVGYYTTTLMHARARSDLTYLEEHSLGSDVRLIARQATAIVRTAGHRPDARRKRREANAPGPSGTEGKSAHRPAHLPPPRSVDQPDRALPPESPGR